MTEVPAHLSAVTGFDGAESPATTATRSTRTVAAPPVSSAGASSGYLGRYSPATDTWRSLSTTGAPALSSNVTLTWTGTEIILFASDEDGREWHGGRYDPVRDAWRPTSFDDAPDPSLPYASAWTGEALVLLGVRDGTIVSSAYDPEADTWRSLRTEGVPTVTGRLFAMATGPTILLCDVDHIGTLLGSAVYDGVRETWRSMSLEGAPSFTPYPSPVGTGTEFFVFDGSEPGEAFLGARYEPTLDTWFPLPADRAPSPRYGPAVVPFENGVLIYGGESPSGGPLADGARFSSSARSWRALTPHASRDGPKTLLGASTVFAEEELCALGDLDSTRTSISGWSYRPARGEWSALPAEGAPMNRHSPRVVPTLGVLIVWGVLPVGDPTPLDGGRFDLRTRSWRPMSSGARDGELDRLAVWAGHEMIVLGTNVVLVAAYDPSADTWRELASPPLAATETLSESDPRFKPTGFWTGAELLLVTRTSLARFSPSENTWREATLEGAPLPARYDFNARVLELTAAAWNGTELIVHAGPRVARYGAMQDAWTPIEMPSLAPPNLVTIFPSEMNWVRRVSIFFVLSWAITPDRVMAQGTPVLIAMGGFWSCGQDEKLKPDPTFSNSAAPMVDVFQAARSAIAQRFGSESFGQFLSCYSIDPAQIHFKTNLGPEPGTQHTSIEEMIARLGAMLASIRDPEVFIVGHSYGGWTAMKTALVLSEQVPIRALVTLDPISHVTCTPDVFLAGISAGSATGGCGEAPRDFSNSELDALASRVHPWRNFYQFGARYLHSSEINAHPPVENVLFDYPFESEALRDHLNFLVDPAVITDIAETFASRLF